jgi:hypothetical protein
MLSTMLYNDVATLAIMAGTEYCTRSLLIDSVPSVVGDVELFCGIETEFSAKLAIVKTIINPQRINFVKKYNY